MMLDGATSTRRRLIRTTSCFTIRIEISSPLHSRDNSTVRLHKRKTDILYKLPSPRFEPTTFLIHDLSWRLRPLDHRGSTLNVFLINRNVNGQLIARWQLQTLAKPGHQTAPCQETTSWNEEKPEGGRPEGESSILWQTTFRSASWINLSKGLSSNCQCKVRY